MEPEDSVLWSEEPATGPYPEPDKSSPLPRTISLRSMLILFSHLHVGLFNCLVASGFPIRTLYKLIFSPVYTI
jgi:hypothetical protein